MSHNVSRNCSLNMDGTWIGWFVNLPVNAYLCRVPNDFIQDRFNLTGLDLLVPNIHQALDCILDTEFDTEYGMVPIDVDPELTAQLYGLIHARYILTTRGVDDMCLKYQRGDFGVCSRIFCNGQLVLPVGLSDRFGESHVKVYCPRCRDIYQPHPRCALLDGAMFGCSFPHMFFMQLPHLLPEPPVEQYIPRIYGFKVHKSALLPPSHDANASNCSSGISISLANNKNNSSGTRFNSNISGICTGLSKGSKNKGSTAKPRNGGKKKHDTPTIRPPMRRFNFTLN